MISFRMMRIKPLLHWGVSSRISLALVLGLLDEPCQSL